MKSYTIEFSSIANFDITDIWEYIFLYDTESADIFFSQINERIDELEEFPFMGAKRDDLTDDARFLVFKKYNIIYEVQENLVLILRVLHGSREISKYL